MKDSITIKSNQKYTTEELFERIKECSFTAGTPEYQEMGIMKQIKLPAVGRYCIKIMSAGSKISLMIFEDMAQTSTYVANSMIKSQLGIFSKALDKDKKPSQELLEKTASELKGHLGI